MYIVSHIDTNSRAWLTVSVVQSCHSAGVYIRNARSRKPSYSFRNYQEAVIQEGAQHRVERDALRRGQGPYIHTRKEAVSMTAKQMVSNDPNLHKVSLILSSSFPGIDGNSVREWNFIVIAYKVCTLHMTWVCHDMCAWSLHQGGPGLPQGVPVPFPIYQFLNTLLLLYCKIRWVHFQRVGWLSL